MQRVYNLKNIGMNYWSCYARVQNRGNSLIIDNTLTDMRIVIISAAENLDRLNDMLETGASDERLYTALKEICAGAGKLIISDGDTSQTKKVNLTAGIPSEREEKNNDDTESNTRLLMELLMQGGMIE